MNTKNSITDIKMEILVKQNWNWNTCLIETEIEMEIHCKTIIEMELKYIANNGIEIETEIYLNLITDTTLGPPLWKHKIQNRSMSVLNYFSLIICIQYLSWTFLWTRKLAVLVLCIIINTTPTDCQASSAEASYGFHHMVSPYPATLLGVGSFISQENFISHEACSHRGHRGLPENVQKNKHYIRYVIAELIGHI